MVSLHAVWHSVPRSTARIAPDGSRTPSAATPDAMQPVVTFSRPRVEFETLKHDLQACNKKALNPES